MHNSNLSIKDFRYAKEVPAFWITSSVGIGLILAMFFFALPVALGFMVGLIVLTISLYLKKVAILGSSVRVNENQFPKIHEMTKIAAQRLNVKLPPVYIKQSPIINAFAMGFVGNHVVILHSALIETMSDDELMYIIGHEFTHIKGHHVLMNVIIGDGAQKGATAIKSLAWLQQIFRFIFLYLGRCFEFTCDRGGMIAVGDVKPCITAQAKLAVGAELFKSLNIMEFYQQALELDRSRLGFLAELESSHPYTLNRIRDAVRFYRSDEYRRIAAAFGKQGTTTLQGSLETGDLMQRIMHKGNPNQSHQQSYGNQNAHAIPMVHPAAAIPQDLPQTAAELCKNCGSPRKGASAFCTACGTKFAPVVSPSSPAAEAAAAVLPVTPVQPSLVQPSPEAQPFVVPIHKETPSATPKACPNCAAVIVNAEAKFCTGCGNKLS